MAAAPTTSQASWSLNVELDYRAQLLQLAKHSSPAQPLWLVAPPELLAWHHQTLARQVPGASVELLSWDRLRETLEELLLLPNLKVTSPQELQVAIAHTLEALIAQGQVPPELGSAYDQDPLGVSAALLPPVRSYSEWVEPATSQTAPHPLSERHLVLLQKLHQGVEATLNGQKLATPPMAWSRILENLDQLPAFACPATIALDGFDRLDIHQLALLRALLDRKVGVLAPSWLDIDHPRVSIGVAVPPLSVCHFTVRDPLDEADAALEWVRSRLQTGAGLLDLAVTVPPGEGYEGCLEKVLSTAGVPVAFTQRVPLGQTKEFEILRALLSLKDGLNLVDLAWVLKAEGQPGFARLISKLYETLPQSWDAVMDLAQGAKLAPDEVSRLEWIIREAKSPIRGPLDASSLDSIWDSWRLLMREEFITAAKGAVSLYCALLGPRNMPADLMVAVERLGEPLLERMDPGGETLAILPIGPFLPRTYRHLLVLGFTDDRLTPTRASLPLLGPLEIVALRGNGSPLLPSSLEVAEDATRNLVRLLGSAPEVTLVSPSRDASGALQRQASILKRLQITHASPPVMEAPASEREWSLQTARALGQGASISSGPRWTLPSRAGLPSYGLPTDTAVALLRRRPLSPSAIDTLIQCPFQFYVRMLLSLEDQIPARGLSFDVALKGTIAHRVLEVMLDRHPDPSLKGSDVGRILEKVLDEDFPALEASALRFELDTLRRDLERFVEGYAQLTRELGVMGGRSEWAFGYDQPVLFNFDPDPAFDSLRDTFGKGFRVRGKVDRVLLRDGRPVVIDFKSGDVRKYSAQRSAGMGAQVGLYAWAVSRTKLGAPEAFAYLSVRNNEANAVVIDNANPHTIRLLSAQPNAETLDGVIRALRRALSNQIAALASGSVEPVDELRAAEFAEAKAHPCTYCANDLLCRQKKG